MKNPGLVAYRVIMHDHMKHFTSIECKVINQNENKLANSLATLATKFMLKKEKMTFRVEKHPGLVKGELCRPEDW